MKGNDWFVFTESHAYIHYVAFSPRTSFSLVYRAVCSVKTLPGSQHKHCQHQHQQDGQLVHSQSVTGLYTLCGFLAQSFSVNKA